MSHHSLTERSQAGWFFAGVRGAVSAPAAVLFATYMGFGGLLHDVGFPVIGGLISTLFVWALPAQVILIGGLAAGTALPAVAIAVALSGVRLMPMVIAILPMVRREGLPKWQAVLVAHYVAVTMWVEGLRLLPMVPREGRAMFAIGLGNALVVSSSIGTLSGYYLTGHLPHPLAIGLLLLTPISFTILLVRNATEPLDWMAIVLGFGLAPLTFGSAGGLDLFWSGVGGGTIAYVVSRFMRKRHEPV